MQFRVLQKSDSKELLNTGGIRTIWQIDPMIDKSVADKATVNYAENLLSTMHSVGIWKNDELLAFVVGSIPQWDSDFFGYDSYVVRHVWSDSNESLNTLLKELNEQLRSWNIRYAYAKLPTAAKTTTRAFERVGFEMADLRVTFNRKLESEKPFPTNIGELVFELAGKEDVELMAELCKEVSKVDRFHGDPNIPEELADEIYYKWVINGAAAGKESVKCLVDGKIAGFHMSYPEKAIQTEGSMPLSISDIMGVYPEFGGRGIGTGLFVNYFALAHMRGQKSVIAGVHVDNIISMRLHEGVGFKAVHTEIGLRKWY